NRPCSQRAADRHRHSIESLRSRSVVPNSDASIETEKSVGENTRDPSRDMKGRENVARNFMLIEWIEKSRIGGDLEVLVPLYKRPTTRNTCNEENDGICQCDVRHERVGRETIHSIGHYHHYRTHIDDDPQYSYRHVGKADGEMARDAIEDFHDDSQRHDDRDDEWKEEKI
ncbi:hypothetical protein PFISCL1PPCAC_27322, partial [Pristionchus fissidentatus]